MDSIATDPVLETDHRTPNSHEPVDGTRNRAEEERLFQMASFHDQDHARGHR